jgi:hypothetical protein
METLFMRETVGFRTFLTLLQPELIKRDALMFKRIGVLGCSGLRYGNATLLEHQCHDVRWLEEQGIIFDPEPELRYIENVVYFVDEDTRKAVDDSNEIFVDYINDSNKLVNFYTEQLLPHKMNLTKEKLANIVKALLDDKISGESSLRPLSVYYRSVKHIDAFPIISGMLPELSQGTGSIEDVIEITINQLPIPDDSTSWEQIIDFRNDPDTETKFRRFRVWMNKIARANLTPLEVEQELEWMLDEYRQHMELHKMKTNTSALETILVSLGDRKFGDIVKGFFSVKHKQIALLEAEAKAPGREIAFISKAQETFR